MVYHSTSRTEWEIGKPDLDIGEGRLQKLINPFPYTHATNENQLFFLEKVEDQAYELLLKGKNEACIKFIQGIPLQLIESKPILFVLQATAMFFAEYAGQKIYKVLDKAEACCNAEKIEGEITAVNALLQSYRGDPELGIKLSEKASLKIPLENTFFQNLVNRNLGVAYTIKNQLQKASLWFEKLLLSSYKLKDWIGVLASYNYLTFIRKVQGRFREANVIYNKAIDFIEQKDLGALPHSIKIIAGYGHLLLLLNRIQEAKQYFYQAINLAKQSDILYAFTAYLYLIEALLIENNFQDALAVLHELQRHTQGMDDLYDQTHKQQTQAMTARINLELGRVDLAYAWLLSCGFETLTAEELHREFGYRLGINLPLAARIYISMGMFDRAIHLLNAINPKFLHQGEISYLIRSLCVLAIAYDLKGEKEKALQAIRKAICFAEPENNIGDFIFAGSQLEPLLMKASQMATATAFRNKLISAFIELSVMKDRTTRTQQPNGPLSIRELDVLKLIAKGMTNQEIATALFLSTSTIKSHSIKIYRKLNVKDRRQAISKAHLLGILPTERLGIYLPD